MAHIGFTPQSEHTLGGYRVQGRGDAADEVLADARAVAEAGAFAVVLEMVPGEVAKRVTARAARSPPSASAPARTPTPRCWSGRTWPACAPARRRGSSSATPTWPASSPRPTRQFADEVRGGAFPAAEHTYR